MSRYIDAEILLDAMRHITLGETDVARSEMKIVHYICHMPHIDDVRENVKGQWTDAQYPFSKCSICDCYFDTANNEANFCPICGADMRGDNNDRTNR